MVPPPVLNSLFLLLFPIVQSISFRIVHSGTGDVFDRSQSKDAFVNTLGIIVIGVTLELVAGMIIAPTAARRI